MRAYMESGFYIVYFVLIVSAGIFVCCKQKNNRAFLLFGLACILLGLGDAFHLVPRAVGLFSKSLDNPDKNLAMWLGIGKLITSITMTVFYVLLYYFIYKRYDVKRNKILDCLVWFLTATRVVLCALPQNNWLTNSSPLIWGIARNIPFVVLGVLVIVLAFMYLRHKKHFQLLWLAIALSFGFYIPVVVWASTASWVGMLMIPKTICYLWIGLMGFLESKYKCSVKK